MGKNSRVTNSFSENESHTPPILEIGFSDPLFSVAAHPTRPITISGLGTGHVFCHTYNPEVLENSLAAKRSSFLKKEKIDKVQLSLLKKKWWRTEADHANIVSDESIGVSWKTKRHKGSCRSVMFDILEGSAGENVFTVGSDSVLKKAKTETGKVQSKIDISSHFENNDAITTLAMSTSNPFLTSGTENGNVLVFDSNNLTSGKLKFKLENVQEDAVNKILPMPAVSAYHFLALGSTRLAHIDIRKGVITQSDDQADELLSMCYPTEFVNAHKNDTVIVTHGEGVITLWRNSTNGLSDQISRVKINRNASIDAIISTMNSGDDNLIDSVWCGDSDGYLHRVDYKRGKVMETRLHSSLMSKSGAVDEVSGLDIDYDYRLVSSGMEGLKIWSGQMFDNLDNPDTDSESYDSASSEEMDMSDFDSDAFSPCSDDNFGEDEAVSKPKASALGTFDAPEDRKEEASEPDYHASLRETLLICKRKRVDVMHTLKKPKKERIDINAIAKKKEANEDKSASNKKATKSMKKRLIANGIGKFNDL
ncbi:WD repeat-containing protein JIP5 [Metschnikowia bicuspidata var. bicuspidata NRRL YB-4993]|uniref:WD repeat-containing protein JIP5 n=1 Tax=Metschnikowia bicuspidata var. bicuspidata NRRL YB-4993 TaxID=869754 RepID=A0A1A0HIC0_9ASCO|nr:WD repeat-containing protein JIP5 [Metschnikowia bicuspidata var. bicuspidata NRRL YB-4993]OBA23914.1 WD repeat-containing protein JIP5 [Metschnikowia bicuspidata var. bicuspidata NRRL YB-4993]